MWISCVFIREIVVFLRWFLHRILPFFCFSIGKTQAAQLKKPQLSSYNNTLKHLLAKNYRRIHLISSVVQLLNKTTRLRGASHYFSMRKQQTAAITGKKLFSLGKMRSEALQTNLKKESPLVKAGFKTTNCWTICKTISAYSCLLLCSYLRLHPAFRLLFFGEPAYRKPILLYSYYFCQ